MGGAAVTPRSARDVRCAHCGRWHDAERRHTCHQSRLAVALGRMRKAPASYTLAMAAGADAGNRSMRAAGRKRWSVEDWNVAAREVERLLGPLTTTRAVVDNSEDTGERP